MMNFMAGRRLFEHLLSVPATAAPYDLLFVMLLLLLLPSDAAAASAAAAAAAIRRRLGRGIGPKPATPERRERTATGLRSGPVFGPAAGGPPAQPRGPESLPTA